jgi:hypothetical protein
MIENLKRSSTLILLFVLLIFSSTITAQNNESGGGEFNWDGINDLDNVNIPGHSDDSTPRDYAWDYGWDNYGNDNTPHIDNPTNEEYYNGHNNGSGSNGSSGNGVNAQKKSIIVLNKTVKPGQKYTQAIKVLRDPHNSTNKYVSNLVINGIVVGTITFSEPQKDANGVDIYTQLTVEVFSNSPIAISSLSPQDAETSEYEGSQHSTDYNLQNLIGEILFNNDGMNIDFNMPMNENEDLIVRGESMPLDTPQSYENALNAVSNGDYIISNGVVKIKQDKGNYYTLVSEADVNSPTVLQRVKNLAAIITKSLGGNGKETLINVEKGADLSSKNPAWTRKTNNGTNTIFINSNDGFSSFLNNIDNFKSVIKHEIFHVEDNRKPNFASNLSTHADVYIKMANNYTFNDTTDEFKKGTAASFARYLMNMATKIDFTLSDIITKIDSFNMNKAQVQILKPIGIITLANLNLRVQYKNIISDPITYEKINE